MSSILKVRLPDGSVVDIPALKGLKGDTPVKGVDYWTEEDKNEIKEYIDTQINTTDGDNTNLVVVTLLTEDGEQFEADKTFEEITNAYGSGKLVIAFVPMNSLVLCLESIDYSSVTWTASVIESSYLFAIRVMLSSSNKVTVEQITCDSLDNRVDEISDELQYEQYPSAIAVKNYVDSSIQSAIYDSWEGAV